MKEIGRLGYGALVRDERGSVIATKCQTRLGSLDLMLAEAGAVLMAIQQCKNLGFQRVHFEGDSKIVVEGVNSTKEDWSGKGMVLEDIKLELQAIPQWRMTFVRRDGNHAAHTLSKWAITEKCRPPVACYHF
jgi:ribonuclease HI